MSAPASGENRLISLCAAVIAVLAALATLFAHHRSIAALSAKNDAILATAKASDQYSAYQTRRVRVALYSTLLSAGVITNPAAVTAARQSRDHEDAGSLAVLRDAKTYEATAARETERSEVLLSSFETLEIATTLLEIAIVFTSISALTESRLLLWMAVGLSAIGVVLMIFGYVQGH